MIPHIPGPPIPMRKAAAIAITGDVTARKTGINRMPINEAAVAEPRRPSEVSDIRPQNAAPMMPPMLIAVRYLMGSRPASLSSVGYQNVIEESEQMKDTSM